ncbi:hypothetical protein A7C91_00245 [Thermococcus piezophilus]|uniref:Uncharacterized protein n=2 Tax=Thermococcus piezophilus TaxID=1712654 RepID=A0A172WEL4_9EURY|nr:hypothetical protein A7C91_00245 [Thermococcus piezophilus]
MNVTFRDIFVNRIARRTGFVREEFVPRTVTPEMAEPMAKVEAEEITLEDIDFIQDYEKCAVMLSGGTESLLSMA